MVLSEREPESTLELAGTEPSSLGFFTLKKILAMLHSMWES